MVQQLDSLVRVLSSAGATLFTFDVAPLELISISVGARSWRRTVITSPFIHGDFQTSAVLAATTLDVAVRIKETTGPRAHARQQALLDALEADDLLVRWILDGVSTTWRAYAPDVTPVAEPHLLRNRQRELLLTFPVQPNPAVTGLPVL